MRGVPVLILLAAVCGAQTPFGTWRTSPVRSVLTKGSGESVTVRIEPHAKGEVFALEKIEKDGRATISSTVLYLDGKLRNFQDTKCSGTQLSRRVDSATVEIASSCFNGARTRIIRRLAEQSRQLILDVTEQEPDGRHSERHFVLEKEIGGRDDKNGHR